MAAKQKSLLLLAKQGEFAVGETDISKPGPGELLVQIHAAALNPLEWKIQMYGIFFEEFPAVLGWDAAGVVKELGEGVTGFAIGDRVLFEANPPGTQAAFQHYAVVPAEITAKIPVNLTFEQAATVSVALVTAATGLFNQKTSGSGAGLVAPWEEGGRGKYAGQPILIIGGSSSVGQHTIQLAKLSGFSPIITTASARHEAYLKAQGATHVLDRNAVPFSELAATLKSITSEPIKLVYDAISLPETQAGAYDVLAPGGTLILVLPSALDESKQKDGKEVQVVQVYGSVHAPAARALGVSLYSKLTELLEVGDIKPNNVELLPGGLAGIPAGLEKLKVGLVSAGKLVVRPQETV